MDVDVDERLYDGDGQIATKDTWEKVVDENAYDDGSWPTESDDASSLYFRLLFFTSSSLQACSMTLFG